MKAGSFERQEAALHWLQENGNTETARRLLARLHSLIETPQLREKDIATNDEAILTAFGAISEIAKREKANSVPLLLEMIEAPTTRHGDNYQTRICAVYILSSLGPDPGTTIPRLHALLNDQAQSD